TISSQAQREARMPRPKQTILVLLVIGLAIVASPLPSQDAEQSEREAMYYRYLEFASYVKGGSIEPHWMADGSSFWYAEGAPANTVIYKVDPRANTKIPLFDTPRLRKTLTPLLGHEPPYQGLPFEEFSFLDQTEKAVKFTVENKEFILQLDTYTITRAPVISEEEKSRLVPQIVPHPFINMREEASPDRRWFAGVKDYNLYLRSTYDGRSVQLTTDGIQGYAWGHDIWNRWTKWSPDSFRLAVTKVDLREYPKIPILHYLGLREELEWAHDYNPLAGERIPQTELFIIDVLSRHAVRVNTGEEPHYFLYISPGWRPDGRELLFQKGSLDWKKLELMAADPETGTTRVVLTETQKTFIIGVERPHVYERLFIWLPDGNKFIWISERDGWRHLYLYSIDGNLIRQLTEGAFPVVEVVTVDGKNGWVYFTAHGDPQRPYDTHLYRVNMEGKGFARLTEATGQHAIQFAPSKDFFLDAHSSVVRPPAVELRKADGTLLRTLSRADIDSLIKELRWNPPEEFVVKAADGETDLHGMLYKPHDFDPDRKYPVIEVIYGGPHNAIVSRSFIRIRTVIDPRALAQLGFVTFQMDARGTPRRGKEFQDVAYGNIGRYEIPDHVAALRQLAETRPYMDLSRVGVTGISFGGYMTIRALLLAPDVYHVGVASAPPAGIEQWGFYMGSPVDNKEGYEYASNLGFASNLKGKLLLIHGTNDEIAPFSNTMKVVDALIRAGKRFDLLILPEQPHRLFEGTMAGYWRESIRRYLQEHLKP
ncbi:S9 family peptidase, partial [Acidobacteriia bacterium AH_259_A11_L15]|nr:S9 family peptidase [Acidobacteriia bacterium AH_259_A11_L15]